MNVITYTSHSKSMSWKMELENPVVVYLDWISNSPSCCAKAGPFILLSPRFVASVFF
jgi:hypothetical protein